MGPHEKMPFIPMHEYEIAAGESVPEELWQMWHRLDRVVIFGKKREDAKESAIIGQFVGALVLSHTEEKTRAVSADFKTVNEARIRIFISEETLRGVEALTNIEDEIFGGIIKNATRIRFHFV